MSGAARSAGWQAGVDVVVVGTGVAGLTAALDAAQAGLRVNVVTKSAVDDASTSWAQGGVAVVRNEHDPGDDVDAHVRDTLAAAAGLADPAAVRSILADGAAAIARLVDRGARFDSGPAGLARTREGGHSADRVIHAGGDATGTEIERALLACPDRPTVLEHHQLVDVLLDASGRAVGVGVLGPDGTLGLIRAAAVVLATGGAGHLFAATTNPAVATGDGLAAALRAGAVLTDLEFYQFHPTVLWTGPGALGHRPLVTEAVRGAGAVLRDATGAPVMTGVHPLGDLAPRDVVSLAVTRRMAAAPGGIFDHVFLDATAIPAATFRSRFPTVTAACLAAGIDPATEPIPVAPAAHYQCGGVRTDLSGRTSVSGLYAVGEVARTGLHGANRLASNSLLEGLVMGERVIDGITADLAAARATPRRPDDRVTAVTVPFDEPAERPDRQALMSRYAGIGRDAAGLSAALTALGSSTQAGISPRTAPGTASATQPGTASATQPVDVLVAGLETANLRLVGRAVLAAAQARTESRGCHVRTDHPARRADLARSARVRLVDGELTVAASDFDGSQRDAEMTFGAALIGGSA